MKNWLNIKIVAVILALSLLANMYFILKGDSMLEKNAFCAQFKEQVAKRVSTYYTNGDVTNIYPNEIFYSKSRGSCIALWVDTETSPAGNSLITSKVILDPITNDEIFSESFLHYFKVADNTTDVVEMNLANEKRYSDLIAKLKGYK